MTGDNGNITNSKDGKDCEESTKGQSVSKNDSSDPKDGGAQLTAAGVGDGDGARKGLTEDPYSQSISESGKGEKNESNTQSDKPVDPMEVDEGAGATEQETSSTAATQQQSSQIAIGRVAPRKRGRSASPTPPRASPTPDGSSASTMSTAAAAHQIAASAQIALICGMTGLSTLFAGSPNSMPTVEQVKQAATRAVNDVPPFVHMSARDSAPQLKIEDGTVGRRLVVRGGMRGYRMARATHGVSEGNYYFEVLILPSPTAKELVASLPPNVRLGRKLQKQLQDQLIREEEQEEQNNAVDANNEESSSNSKKGRKRKADEKESDDVDDNQISVGGHVRIGWSMRTGDLQAPVGYDKWSYGLRDISGSRCHNSRREDAWGGEPFGPGDIVGFAISLVGPDASGKSGGSGNDDTGNSTHSTSSSSTKKAATNHIRFFKNGEAMGHFVIARGKREGGAAFDNIHEGTYYPAISSYMGGSVKVNFGPYFVYPPRILPTGMKMKPFSDLCEAPPSTADAVAKAMKERSFSKKTDEAIVNAFRDAIETEAQIRHDAYTNHLSRHVEEVREARQERNLSTGDLPDKSSETDAAMTE